MPRWAKIVLVAFVAGFALLALGLVFAGRWIREQIDSITGGTVAAQNDGRKFGTGREAEACVAASLERIQGCGSVLCETQTLLFLTSCFETATMPPGYCDEIRKRTAQEECERRGRKADERCIRVISIVHTHCEPPA
jgi:hypothetical protein